MLAVFEKGERLRHIGHLDIMRAMQRALRRSGLPVAYSNGFNPHILLTFASALSVGAVGKREVMDVCLAEDTDPGVFMNAMNHALPPDLQLISCRAIDDRHPAPMSQVSAAEYSIRPAEADSFHLSEDILAGFLKQEDIQAERKTKSGIRSVNIRPLIQSLNVSGTAIHTVLTLTETQTCKPDMLLSALCAYMNCDIPRVRVTRLRLLGLSPDNRLVPVEDL